MVEEVVAAVLLWGYYQVVPTVCHLCTSTKVGGGRGVRISERNVSGLEVAGAG